jgi:type IX secretion system PorP/SprF family membrane protein
MLKKRCHILLLTVMLPVICYGQEIDPGPGYQMIMMSNPAFAGSEGDGRLRLSYLNFYPGNNYNLHTIYLSYDSYFPLLHGGAGIYLSDDYMGGIVNDMRGGLSYAYFLKVGRDLFINAGLSASVFHRGFNFEGAVLPDQIDPLGGISIPPSEQLINSSRSAFDIGAGFLFISGQVFGGFSIGHLTEPDLSQGGIYNEKLRRKILIHLSGNIYLNETRTLRIRPLGFFGEQNGFNSGGTGAVFESNFLSVNAILLGDNRKNINFQTGFSVKTGGMSVFYNYRFNVVSGNNLLPFSLIHQTGLAFTLKNVDKRNAIKTINYPKL